MTFDSLQLTVFVYEWVKGHPIRGEFWNRASKVSMCHVAPLDNVDYSVLVSKTTTVITTGFN